MVDHHTHSTGITLMMRIHEAVESEGHFHACSGVWGTFLLRLSSTAVEARYKILSLGIGPENSLCMPDLCFQNIGLTWAKSPDKLPTQYECFEFKLKFILHCNGEQNILKAPKYCNYHYSRIV